MYGKGKMSHNSKGKAQPNKRGGNSSLPMVKGKAGLDRITRTKKG